MWWIHERVGKEENTSVILALCCGLTIILKMAEVKDLPEKSCVEAELFPGSTEEPEAVT